MNLKLILIFFIFSIFGISQQFKLGKVSIQELEQKHHLKEPEAEAAFIFNKLNYNIEKGYKTYTSKIKIYNSSGLNWGNIEVFSEINRESFNILHAFTYNLENGNIIKTKVKKENIFETKVNDFILKTSIAFPEVKAGSVIEFEYTISSTGINYVFEWQFEKKIPVDYSEVYVQLPNNIEFKTHIRGFLYPKILNEKYEKKYTLINIPGFKEEPFVNNYKNYLSSILFELSQTYIPGRMTDDFSSSWSKVIENIYNLSKFKDELNKKGYFEDELNKELEGKLIRDERIDAVFNFVKKNVKWNNKFGYTCAYGIKEAFKNRNGNVAEINLMLTAMLRYAGIDANPILCSTQSNGFVIKPSLTAFNYVISGIEIENEIILLDATDEFSKPNILPKRVLNWNGKILRKNGTFADINLIPNKTSFNNYNLLINILDNRQIKGKLRNSKSNYYALFERTELKNLDKNKLVEKFENEFEKINIDDIDIENLKEVENPLNISFSFEKNNEIEIINDKLYFSPLFFLKLKDNPFKAEKREYPIDFTFPYESNYNIIITIPEGYTLESFPEQVKITLDELASFSFLVNTIGNKIHLKVIQILKTPKIYPIYYVALKEYYQKMIDKSNEKIVLKKI